MEPLKIIFLIITTKQKLDHKTQNQVQALEQQLLQENLGHIQNVITSEPVTEKIQKKIEQMTNTNCEVLIILNFSEMKFDTDERIINQKLVLTYSESLITSLKRHQKTIEKSFGCNKGCL